MGVETFPECHLWTVRAVNQVSVGNCDRKIFSYNHSIFVARF